MDLDLLKEIGLTDGEIKVYIALFKLGSTSTGPLIKESGVHASKVYLILDRLIEKGLVSYIKEGKKTIYTANPATTIISYLDKLQSKIVKQKQSAKELISELDVLKSLGKKETEATLFKGVKGLKAAYNLAIKDLMRGEEVYSMFLPPVAKHLVPFFVKFVTKLSKEYKTEQFLLFNQDCPEAEAVKELPNLKLKFGVSQEHKSPAEVCVYGDNVLISTTGGEEYITFLIKNKEISDSFRNQFKEIWAQKVWTYQGIEGMKLAFEEALSATPKGATSYVFGATKTSRATDELFFKYNKRRAEKGIKLKILFNEEATSSKTTRAAKPENNPLAEIKIMPQESTPSVYEVFPDRVIITTASKENPTSIVIKDKEFVETCIIQFNELWNQDVRVSYGLKALAQVHEKTYQQLTPGEEYVYLGVPKYQPEEQHEYWRKDHLRREKAGIKCRLLFNNDTSKKTLINRNSYSGCDARYMPTDIKTPSYLGIFKNTVMMAIPKENPIVIEINNKEIADSFKAYFEEFWKISKKELKS